jgi:hypothetical protein
MIHALLQLQISGGQTNIPCIVAILHASVGTGPVKLFFPKDNMAVKKVKF